MYIATFYTHFGATAFGRSLSKLNIENNMMPVPRVLSASCGVCIRFKETASLDFSSFQDLDSVYEEKEDGSYQLILKEE